MRCFLFLSSKDLRIVYASPYTRALFGSRSGHIIGEPLTNFLHPDERAQATADMKTFVQAKTLYGSLTNCQLYNFDTQTYEPIDLYTNVVTENVIFASIFKYTGEYVNSYLKTDEHEIQKIKLALEKLDQENFVSPNPNPVHGEDPFYTRTILFYETETMFCHVIWPPSNFNRLTGWEASTAEQHVLDQRSQSAQSTQSAQQNDNKFAFDSAEDDASIGSSQKKSTNPACTSPPLSSSSSFSSSSSSSPSSSSPNSSNSNSNSNCSCDKDCLSLQSLEMAAFLNDVRSLQNISGDQVKRFCTVNYIYNSKKLFTALDSVLDVQNDLTIIMSQLNSEQPQKHEGNQFRRMIPISHKESVSSKAQTKRTKACESCGKIRSPEWRKGPNGEKTLCNACGLRYSRSQKKKFDNQKIKST